MLAKKHNLCNLMNESTGVHVSMNFPFDFSGAVILSALKHYFEVHVFFQIQRKAINFIQIIYGSVIIKI